ncbi:hypothetical protein [Streptomyces anulatus]|uniref:hypothetical protein n=1 Tax=Streptomyces anulatus TaxID=1892 RepID=UPI0036AC11CD
MLHRIVTIAMDLTNARYGALGVVDDSGDELEQFITAGLSTAGSRIWRGRSSLADAACSGI